MKIFKHNFFYLYFALFIYGLAAFVATRFSTTPLTFLLIFFALLIIPGFSLCRIFRISFASIFEQKLLWIITGLTYGLLVCLAAILFHLNMASLMWTYLILTIVLFFSAWVLDYSRSNEEKIDYDLKSIIKLDNLIMLGLILFALIIVATVSQLGGNFDGDPAYHLAIMRKAMDAQTFSIGNLSFVKDHPMPAYAIMIWPVFLSLLAKITNLQTYDLWGQIPAALTLLVFLVWYGLFRKIFNNRVMSVLLVVLFAIFMFEGTGYLLTRLAVPDTAAKLVLVPMALWLAMKYVFEEKVNFKILAILSIFLPIMALVHLTQYFYFYLIMGTFIVLYAIMRFKDADYSTILKRMLGATFSNLVLAIPLFGILQLKTGLVTSSYNTLSGRVADPELKVDSVVKFDIFTKYAYILFPLILLFVRKNKTLLIVLGSMIIAPIIFHIPFIYNIVNSAFSFVFMKRLFSNVTWYFAIWALALGFVVLVKDRYLANQKVFTRRIWSGMLVAIAALMWIFREQIYKQLFSSGVDKWLNTNFWWLFIGLAIISIIIFVLQAKSEKLNNYFKVEEPKNTLIACLLVFAFVAIFSFSLEKTVSQNLKAQFENKSCFTKVKDSSAKAVSAKKLGGWDTLDFIKTNIAAGSIFESDITYRDLPIMYNVHMVAWPNESLPEKAYSKVYEAEGDTNIKMQCLAKGKAEYLLVSKSRDKNITVIKGYLLPIYQNEAIDLYKIDQVKIATDLGDDLNSNIDCRARQYKK